MQTLADRYIMHIRVQFISSLSCQVSCVHQFFSCAWMCKHKNAVAPCGAKLIRPFSGHWVRIFNGKQNVNVWIMRPNISDINSRCNVAWNPLNWPPDTAHANRRHFESGRNWQLRPPVVPRDTDLSWALNLPYIYNLLHLAKLGSPNGLLSECNWTPSRLCTFGDYSWDIIKDTVWILTCFHWKCKI